ncbi:bifunctional 3-(3-hydroxy-phenyl)propionate/3-hydroxycinnamic acid hydroxylase [Plantactinospora sp. S1510]|uniref:Bifunctional 3-(3-hydroxy-phenyl)propionate/3-hydroxycinnamic acid hydroxylase n=1 Tax=Plantactinospora alkalitolerans TaxID=2789879 RepID=A0ABS0GRC7_9ACTN|nr:bifunctional 3-(3-hydroxy-phenyl)propionate/3-hydroxycinnamic acid hydroxylase [Plantactinospora alkalitolerans]MBF9128457.1 bifunctional 3-(3-hydroxy-phenyl)propionate/3-hydroxycinnamic acid hydroxylase [Plantactinospora alkalitolerans]
MTDVDVDVDVIVAGYGPVGAVLAALLGRRGVPTMVVDPGGGPCPLPRAAVLDAEVLRVLVGLPGAADLDRWAVQVRHSRFLGPDHSVLISMSPTDSGFGLPAAALIDQPELEAALREGIDGLPAVSVRLGRSVTALEPADDHVRVGLDDGTTVRARWVVGCDGASSTVRRLADLPFHGQTYAVPWLVVDAGTDETDVEASTSMVLDPRRPLVTMASPGRRRWEWMLHPDEDPAEFGGTESVRRLVADWVDPDTIRLRRVTVFTFHARQAEHWRRGRIMLAGDAAHLLPPFAGQGLASGIRDVQSLAWRLTDVLRGLAVAGLLDGYERERRPHVAELIRVSLGVGRVLQTRNRALSAVLRLLVRAVAAIPGMPARAARQGRPRPALPKGTGGELPGGGRMLPNPLVGTADHGPVRLDELLGPGWAVIGLDCDPLSVADAAARAWIGARDAVTLTTDRAADPRGPGSGWIEDGAGALGGGPAVLVVRPDRFLLGVMPPPLSGRDLDRAIRSLGGTAAG